MLAVAAALTIGIGSVALAAEKEDPGKSGETPGHEMQEHGSVPGHPGASGYAPGHTKDADDVRKHETTGTSDRARDDSKLKDHDRDAVKLKSDRDHDRDDTKIKRD
jgi:hypothetical protein